MSPMRLSPREREVVVLLSEGMRTRQIAARLRVSEPYVKQLKRSIVVAMRAQTVVQAMHVWTMSELGQ